MLQKEGIEGKNDKTLRPAMRCEHCHCNMDGEGVQPWCSLAIC